MFTGVSMGPIYSPVEITDARRKELCEIFDAIAFNKKLNIMLRAGSKEADRFERLIFAMLPKYVLKDGDVMAHQSSAYDPYLNQFGYYSLKTNSMHHLDRDEAIRLNHDHVKLYHVVR